MSSPSSSSASSPSPSSPVLPLMPVSQYDGLFSPIATDAAALDLEDESPALELDALLALMSRLPDPSVPSVPAMHYKNCYIAFTSTFRANVCAAIPGAEKHQIRIVAEGARRWQLCDRYTKDLWRQIVKASNDLFSPNPNSRRAGKPRAPRKAPRNSSHRESRNATSATTRHSRLRKAGARSRLASPSPSPSTSSYPDRASSDSPPPLIPRSPNSLPPLLPPSPVLVPATVPLDPALGYLLYYSDPTRAFAAQRSLYPWYIYGIPDGFYNAYAFAYGTSGIPQQPHAASASVPYYASDNAYNYHDTYSAPPTFVDPGMPTSGTAELPVHHMQDSQALPSQVFSENPSPPTDPQVSFPTELEQAESLFDSLDTEVLSALWVQLQESET